MSMLDAQGHAVTGATPASLAAYECALGAVLAWRGGAGVPLDDAIAEAPGFVMAHALQAYRLVCSRDPARVRSAQAVLELAAALPANEREAAHLAAIASVLADDYDFARETLTDLLRQHPCDVLALHAAHALDYLSGDAERLSSRVAELLPLWSDRLPAYHAVLSMHAFGLVEHGDCEGAEQTALAALALDPLDARAHHAMAHVFEMTDRAEAGARWLRDHLACWAQESVVATHCWWHLALFELDRGRVAEALMIYDQRVRIGLTRATDIDDVTANASVADLIDASALLWRLQLRGCDVGTRWRELAEAWSAHTDDAFCSFTDVHAMLALVGARDWHRARRLERSLAISASLPTRYGKTTRMLGLPACRALLAFGRGDCAQAIGLLAGLPALAHRLGGSHAQRDVLHLTLLQAIQRVRRPILRPAERSRTQRLPDRAIEHRPEDASAQAVHLRVGRFTEMGAFRGLQAAAQTASGV